MLRYLSMIFLLVASLSAFAQMTHEEQIVRTAYGKLSYAVAQGAISDLAMEANRPRHQVLNKENVGLTSDERIANAQLEFTLSDFNTGNLRDILGRKIIDFITTPGMEVLRTSSHQLNYAGAVLHWLNVDWQPGRAVPPEAMNLTIQDAYDMQWKAAFAESTLSQRYASYTVTLRYKGKVRGPYKAMFVFGHDAKGNEVVQPSDPTADNIALGYALQLPLFPDGLVRTRLREYPVVADWLEANTVPGACSAGNGNLCCDLERVKCGLGRDDLRDALSKPALYLQKAPSGQ